MNERRSQQNLRSCLGILGAATLAIATAACGGPVASGVAVGKVGHGLSGRAAMVPQGAEVCAMQEALSAPIGSEKPIGEGCTKSMKNDLLWRRSLVVLGAYGQTLESIAGGNADTSGRLEAASTGVRGADWIDVDGGPEQAARGAVAQLVNLMANGKGDLGGTVKDAAPHVKTLCDGLTAYLEAQAKGFADVQKDAEKKRAMRGDRRCGTLGGQSVCVGESPVDRMVYANIYGQAALLEQSHLDARDNVAGFCAAHRKAEEAAADGRLGKDQTFADIVEAVKAAQRAPASGGGKTAPPKK